MSYIYLYNSIILGEFGTEIEEVETKKNKMLTIKWLWNIEAVIYRLDIPLGKVQI